jgi:hypothetical protein
MRWYPVLSFRNADLRHYLWLSFPIMMGYRIVVRTKQEDFAPARASVPCNVEVQTANSRDLIGKPLDGIALLLPLVLDIRRGRLQRLRTKDVTLADLACKLLDMSPKVLHQRLLFGAHDKPL